LIPSPGPDLLSPAPLERNDQIADAMVLRGQAVLSVGGAATVSASNHIGDKKTFPQAIDTPESWVMLSLGVRVFYTEPHQLEGLKTTTMWYASRLIPPWDAVRGGITGERENPR